MATEKIAELDDVSGDVADLLAEAEEAAARATNERRREGYSSGLVKRGGKELPDRVQVYRRINGMPAMVPTATVAQTLAKRDSNGLPVFVRKLPEGVVQPTPIDQTCLICRKKEVKKVFYDYTDYEGHMEVLHPREWRAEQRAEERRERQEEREILRQLVTSGQVRSAPTVKEAIANAKRFRCDEHDREFNSQGALNLHRKSHVS